VRQCHLESGAASRDARRAGAASAPGPESTASNLAIYNSLYIALALRSKQVFVTLDVKQRTAAAAEGVTVKPITDFKP